MSSPGRIRFLYARGHDEAYLFMTLHPCVCGEDELLDRSVTTEPSGDLAITRFSGRCPGCGRQRQFTFRMPATTEVSFEVRYGVGDEPSQLIDAGEWLGVAQLYAMSARERIDAGNLTDEAEISRVYFQLTSALGAYQEAMKFIPAGEQTIPEGAFWSAAGRVVFESGADLLTRERLAAEADDLRTRVAEFEDRYGEAEATTSG